MRVNYVESLFTLVYILIFATHVCIAFSSSNGRGIYQTNYNTKKNSSPAVKKEAEKFFLGAMTDHSRAPSHDTPASPCKCSKFTFSIPSTVPRK